jgi:hypothetical protein
LNLSWISPARPWSARNVPIAERHSASGRTGPKTASRNRDSDPCRDMTVSRMRCALESIPSSGGGNLREREQKKIKGVR